MNILSIELQGFRSFDRAETLTIPPGRGFYLLTGKNEAEPSLGNNGAGKSTVWDALSWCLWGVTSRGLSGKSIVRWAAKDGLEAEHTTVTVVLQHHGAQTTVTRTQAPNCLKWKTGAGEWKMVEQAKLTEWLGLTHEAFMQTVLMGQFGEFFFDMAPADKLAMFSAAMGLDKWTGFAKEAAEKAKAAEASLSSATATLAGAEAGAAEIAEQLAGLEEAAAVWETSRKKRAADALARASKAEEAKEAAQAEETEHTARLAVSRASAAKLDGQLETASGHVSRLAVERERAEAKVRNCEAEKKGLKMNLDRIRGMVGGSCPTCKTTVCLEHADSIAEESKTQAQMLNIQIREAQETLETNEADTTLWKGRLAKVKEKKTALDGEAGAIMQQQRQASATAQRYASDQRTAQREHSSVEAETNPHAAGATSAKAKAARYEADITKAKAQRKTAEGQVLESTFWAKEFKAVRLWLMDKALRDLEIEVNNALIQLGLKEWCVEFSVERDNASGGVTRGFSVAIASPHSTESVPWKAWSGGETQRLRIAGAIGLSSFLRGRLGVSPNIEVWDEPTEHLSDQGVDDLLEFMAHRSHTEGRSIWLIDPRSLEAGAFDGRYLVTKQVVGSTISLLSGTT